MHCKHMMTWTKLYWFINHHDTDINRLITAKAFISSKNSSAHLIIHGSHSFRKAKCYTISNIVLLFSFFSGESNFDFNRCFYILHAYFCSRNGCVYLGLEEIYFHNVHKPLVTITKCTYKQFLFCMNIF